MIRYVAILCGMLILAGCEENGSGEIAGTVSYLQRIALPPDARLTVRLEDVSRQDAAAKIVAEVTRPTNGAQVPLPYELSYSTSEIAPSHRYQLRATITDKNGKLLFTTTQAHPVVPEGERIEMGIFLQPVPPAQTGAAPADAAALENIEWQLVAIGRTLMMGYDGDKGASLLFEPQGQKIAGSTGCNRYFGTYSLEQDQLSLSPAGMTRMACPTPLMAQEQQFIEALGSVTGYRLDGRALELLSGREAVARFEPRAKS